MSRDACSSFEGSSCTVNRVRADRSGRATAGPTPVQVGYAQDVIVKQPNGLASGVTLGLARLFATGAGRLP